MITGFHHLSAITKDADRNMQFYTQVLGLRLVKNTVNQENLKDPHLFYGDYQGNPGTVLTFFEIPKVGNRHDEDSYFHTVYLNIPKGSLPFWKGHLSLNQISFNEGSESELLFADPDGMDIGLIEVDDIIAAENATRHTAIPRDRQIIGIHGIHYTVRALEQTLAFFTQVLGMRSEDNVVYPQNSREDVNWLAQSTSTESSRLGKGAIDHIAYSVPDASDFEALLANAKEKSILIEKVIDRGYFSSIYLREPSGLRIEVATEKPGFTLDETLEHLGESFALPDFLEPKREEIEENIRKRV
ncbi:glyoxalase/bleomycin resistance protein/dihydroxybiphenyl dioxygenase [Trichococcus palustris]|uniref:Glyoxalase/bleomycin resistance protein/dihydroxybiphenyl dioxygenase n=1 Tax=Trichococcus palustris TaxID=140314 RepID=A0A143Y9A9_9LACT|nr:VOC family protein [Trichococcus palustris]CZQ81307.1 glyoxalase/bleomycin resistance protein/dihydroxybiphenyl dioxygenase [Trichococcus palustris]SFK62877.1 Glyoxalase/Bleomycin resistance protein/Dioxygenase superfamily protein [Trichococcus palustris]